jgi:hypothetical protein
MNFCGDRVLVEDGLDERKDAVLNGDVKILHLQIPLTSLDRPAPN